MNKVIIIKVRKLIKIFFVAGTLIVTTLVVFFVIKDHIDKNSLSKEVEKDLPAITRAIKTYLETNNTYPKTIDDLLKASLLTPDDTTDSQSKIYYEIYSGSRNKIKPKCTGYELVVYKRNSSLLGLPNDDVVFDTWCI